MLKIIKSNEQIKVSSVCVLIYGPPGVGKTSTSFTAEKPLLLDFDKGAYRSAYRKDSVAIGLWPEAANISADDVVEYETIVIDTVGRLLDMLAADLIKNNSKLGYNGALSLQGYGQLKAVFAQWMKRLRTIGKDVILIAHDKEEKKGDSILLRPEIQGSSYSEVFKQADCVGYIHNPGNGLVIDFNPTDEKVGKNCSGFKPTPIPNYTQESHFFAGVITGIKESLNNLSLDGKRIVDAVSDYRGQLESVDSAKGMNEFLTNINKEPDATIQKQVKHFMLIHCDDIGLEFDAKAKSFSEKVKENAA